MLETSLRWDNIKACMHIRIGTSKLVPRVTYACCYQELYYTLIFLKYKSGYTMEKRVYPDSTLHRVFASDDEVINLLQSVAVNL